jgi:hypothetical protein
MPKGRAHHDSSPAPMTELGPEGPEEKKVHLHTKIRTSTYAGLLIYMREANLQHLGDVVDRMLGEYLDAAHVKAVRKKRVRRRKQPTIKPSNESEQSNIMKAKKSEG